MAAYTAAFKWIHPNTRVSGFGIRRLISSLYILAGSDEFISLGPFFSTSNKLIARKCDESTRSSLASSESTVSTLSNLTDTDEKIEPGGRSN
jgi:hypothetical protein